MENFVVAAVEEEGIFHREEAVVLVVASLLFLAPTFFSSVAPEALHETVLFQNPRAHVLLRPFGPSF